MKPKVILSLLPFILILILGSCQREENKKELIASERKNTPSAPKKWYSSARHGVTIHDEYHWMEDRNNPELIRYLESENEYADSLLKPQKHLEDSIFNELLSRFNPEENDLEVLGNYEYFNRRDLKQEYPVYYRRPKGKKMAEVLVDFNQYIPPNRFFSLPFFEISPDQQHLAFAFDTTLNAEYNLIIRNISNKALADTIPGVSTSAVWAEDSQTLFYTTSDEPGQPNKVFQHKIFLPYEEDKMEYWEEDPDYSVSLSKSSDLKFLLITAETSNTSEMHYLPSDEPNQGFRLFSPRMKGIKYQIYPHHNKFYIRTNHMAPEFQIMKASEGATEIKNWQPHIPYSAKVTITDLDVYENYLIIYKKEHGVSFIEINDLRKGSMESISFNEPWLHLAPVNFSNFKDDSFRFQYITLNAPPSVFQYDLSSNKGNIVSQGVIRTDSSKIYHSEKVYAMAEDGNQIPIILIYRQGSKRDVPAPLVLFSNESGKSTLLPSNVSPYHIQNNKSLLDRGYILAYPQVRGSNTMNVKWREAGNLLLKKTAIDDFILCADFLVASGITAKDKLIAVGEESGAVLPASAANMRPGLFKIIIAKNPKVDLLNAQINLNPTATKGPDGFGNPDDEETFSVLLTYSPYDNIEVKGYPHIFITNDFYNPTIHFFEAAKWVARLREYSIGRNEIVLQTNFAFQRSAYERLRDTAKGYAFILDILGQPVADQPVADRVDNR